MNDTPNGHPIVRDEEYKDAIQSVVDDNMRTDVLGPGFCKVIDEHKPASDKIKAVMSEAILKEPTVKDAIASVMSELDAKRKSRWIDRGIGVVVTLAIGAAGAWISKLIK